MVHAVGQRRGKRVGDKRALARARNAGDKSECSQGNGKVHLLQVVRGCTLQLDGSAARLAALGGDGHALAAAQVLCGERAFHLHDFLRGAGGNHFAAQLARARAHVYDVVGAADGVLVVLHHHNGVAQIAQVLQRADKALVVTLVQADGGLVQDVQHAHQARADLGCQADALGLAAGKRCSGALERKVVQSHIHQELKAGFNLLHDRNGDGLLRLREGKPLEERQRVERGHLAYLMDVLAAHGNCEDLGVQALAAAGCARDDGKVLLVLLALTVGGGLLVAVHDRLADALPLDEPVGFAAIDRDVINPDLLPRGAVHHDLLDLLRDILPRGLRIHAVMKQHRAHHLRVVVARAERRHSAFLQRKRFVGNHQAGINLFTAADAQAVGAGAVGGVERKVARLKLGHGMPVLGTGKRQREQVLTGGKAAGGARRGNHVGRFLALLHHLHQNAAFGQLAGHFHRLGNAGTRAFFQHHAVYHDLDEVLELLVQRDGLAAELRYLAVDAHAAEALFLQVLEQLGELALPAGYHRRHDERPFPFTERHHVVGYLVGGLGLDLAPAFRAMGNAHAREQQAQVVVDLGNRAHGGTRVLAGGFLVDGNGGRKAVDGIQVGLAHLPQELAGIAGKAFHVAALAFGVDGVERQRALPRAGKAGDDHQLVARDNDIDVLEVVLARTLDNDGALRHACPSLVSLVIDSNSHQTQGERICAVFAKSIREGAGRQRGSRERRAARAVLGDRMRARLNSESRKNCSAAARQANPVGEPGDGLGAGDRASCGYTPAWWKGWNAPASPARCAGRRRRQASRWQTNGAWHGAKAIHPAPPWQAPS